MKTSIVWKCVIVLNLFYSVQPAKILFIFTGGNVSHKTGVWPWVLELAQRGHNVTFISPHSKTPKAHPNILDHAPKKIQAESSSVFEVDRFKQRDEGTEKDVKYGAIATAACSALITSRDEDPILESVYSSNYDLVVVNEIFGECGLYIGHYFKAKTILYDSCTFIAWNYDVFGVTPEAAWIPDILFTAENVPMTFWDRVKATFVTWYWGYMREVMTPGLKNAVRPLLGKETSEMPTLYELSNNVSLVLVNSHPSVDFARTLPPLFVDVGGMASGAPLKDLSKDIKEFMDGAGPGGVVLISFGSTVLLNTIDAKYQAMFFHLIERFPRVRFLMRWKGPLPKFVDAKMENVLVSEWLPQREILNHPKTKLFVTHGGISSIQEATYFGVPLVAMPLFADQDYNAYRVHAQEVGVRLEIRGITAETMGSAVETVLKDNKFKTNMNRKQAIFKDRPISPVDTAVFWTEFVLRHDDTISTLRPMNKHLNALQLRLIDVYAFYICGALSILGFLILVLKCTLNFMRHTSIKAIRESAKKLN